MSAEGKEPPSSLRSQPPEGAALPSGRPSGQRAGFVRAMPWLFVLIWSTGFVVARLAMPHAPPFGFLTIRFALSAVCFVVWIAIAGAAWPKGRWQWFHLAVIGLLDAGRLPGRRLGGGEGAGSAPARRRSWSACSRC